MLSSHSYVMPDSVFAQTALEMVATHGPESGSPDDHMCDRCQAPLPCPPVRNAILVLEAAGLPVHPAGSTEARRASAESALGHPLRRTGDAGLPGTPSGARLPVPPEAGLPRPDAALPDAALPVATLPVPGDDGLPVPPAAEPAEASVGAPAADGITPGSPGGPPSWPDPTKTRAVA